MAKSVVFRRGEGGEVGFNMTPMIDCTFQLIIFFLLAGSFASLDNVRLQAPELTHSVAQDQKLTNKAVVNVAMRDDERSLVGAGRAGYWTVGGVEIAAGDRDRLEAELRSAKAAFERRREVSAELKDVEFQVEIRADRRIRYSDVQPVMMAAAGAGISRMNITALESGGRR